LVVDMMGKAQARSTAYSLYQRSRELVIDAKADLKTVRAELEPSSPPKFHRRPRNRSVTAPTPDSRPPPPPVLPPGYSPTTGLRVVQPSMDIFTSQYRFPNNNSPPHIFDAADVTSEPEGTESLPLSPTSPPKSSSPGDNPHQLSPGIPTIAHHEPEDIDPLSNAKYGKRPDSGMTWRPPNQETSVSGPVTLEPQYSPPLSDVAQYESHTPPRTQPGLQMASSSYTSPPDSTAEPKLPQKSLSVRHPRAGAFVRPKPVVIQEPELPYLSLQDALEWRRKRKGNGTKKLLKNWQYLDRLKDRDHVSVLWLGVTPLKRHTH
jgi:hypothetical protein